MPETWDLKELVNAGWSETDLAWETAAEATADAAAQKDFLRAKEEAGQLLQMARANFEPIDPRLGTSLANYGVCLSLAGDDQAKASLFAKALEVWKGSGPWIARMDAPRVARSSMFHLRMEARHRDTYRGLWQQRWREIAAETVKRLDALNAPDAAVAAPASDTRAVWRRERPAMLNDTRKLMAAALLLLAPPVSDV